MYYIHKFLIKGEQLDKMISFLIESLTLLYKTI